MGFNPSTSGSGSTSGVVKSKQLIFTTTNNYDNVTVAISKIDPSKTLVNITCNVLIGLGTGTYRNIRLTNLTENTLSFTCGAYNYGSGYNNETVTIEIIEFY